MNTIYEGKTKNVVLLDNKQTALLFKDSVTGTNGKHDPGANQVGLEVEEMGNYSLRTSIVFFKLLEENSIPTHYKSHDLSQNIMCVKDVKMLPLEFICRLKAVGSLVRRYGKFFKNEQNLDYLFEVTIKDDLSGDPMINEDQLLACELLKGGEYQELKELTQKITKILKDFLAKRNVELYDIKFEFARNKNGDFVLADDISPSCMRCFQNGKKMELVELAKAILD